MIRAAAMIQALTCALLAVAFWRSGDSRLAVAELCYAVATVALFAR